MIYIYIFGIIYIYTVFSKISDFPKTQFQVYILMFADEITTLQLVVPNSLRSSSFSACVSSWGSSGAVKLKPSGGKKHGNYSYIHHKQHKPQSIKLTIRYYKSTQLSKRTSPCEGHDFNHDVIGICMILTMSHTCKGHHKSRLGLSVPNSIPAVSHLTFATNIPIICEYSSASLSINLLVSWLKSSFKMFQSRLLLS